MPRRWRSHALLFASALPLIVCLPSPARASWATDGNLVVGPSCASAWPAIVPNATGAYLAWVDARSGYNTDIRATSWTTTGVAANGWTRYGDLVTYITCAKYDLCAVSDGAGGALYAWGDDRCVGYQQVYACRVTSAGATSAGWIANGVHLAPTGRDQVTPAIAADGAGGAFVAWQDSRGADADIYLQHVDGTGAIVAGWPAAGLGIAVVAGVQTAVALASDGAGGVFVTWQDRRAGNDDVFLQHVIAAGSLASGWTANGVAVCSAPGDQRAPIMVADDAGGVVLAWQDHRGADWDVYAQRVQDNATLVPGWSPNGTAVCLAGRDQLSIRMVRDGSHGVLMAWQDRRGADWDVYAIRITATASVFPGWLAGGSPIATGPSDQTAPDLAADDTGGAYVAWQDNQSGDADIRAVHLTIDGSNVAGWPAGGSLVCGATGDQTAPRIAVSGRDAFVVWADSRDGGGAPALYAQHLLPGGPVQVRPTGLTALHHDGQTFLTWISPPDTGWTHRVYYRATPIATDADLRTATLLGSVGDSSATDRRLSTLLNTLCTFRCDSLAAPLAPEQGLFVVTVPASRLGCYAVTSQLHGAPEDVHIVPGGNALMSPVTESLDPPRPVFQGTLTQGSWRSGVYTLWTWPHDTPLFPSMSNRASWPFDCGVTAGAPGGPAFVRPHQRGGSFTEQLVASGSPSEWVLGLDDYSLNSDVQTYWYGYHPGYDFTSEANLPPTTGTVVDYTNRRSLYTIRWFRRTFAIDTSSVYAFGYSLGGTYSMHLGLQHPELIVAAMSSAGKVDFSFESDPEPGSLFNSGAPMRLSLTNLWGATSTNLPTTEGLPVYSVMNDDSLAVRAAGGGAAFIVNFAGRHDMTVGWAEKRGFYSATEASRLGGIEFWDNRDHVGSVCPGALAPMLDLRYLYRFRSNLSWPAFSRCSANGDPGDFTATSGDSVGTLNGYMDWDPALVDSDSHWEVVLRTRGLTTLWGQLPAPESLTVDVTPRRVQRFRPAPGVPVTWTATRLSDGTQVQSGSVNLDELGRVTLCAVRTYRTGTRLALQSLAGGVGVTPGTVHPRALTLAPIRNPVRGHAALDVEWPGAGFARVTLFDPGGRRVRALWEGAVSDGSWHATADLHGLPAGVYLVRAQQAQASAVRRVVLLR